MSINSIVRLVFIFFINISLRHSTVISLDLTIPIIRQMKTKIYIIIEFSLLLSSSSLFVHFVCVCVCVFVFNRTMIREQQHKTDICDTVYILSNMTEFKDSVIYSPFDLGSQIHAFWYRMDGVIYKDIINRVTFRRFRLKFMELGFGANEFII